MQERCTCVFRFVHVGKLLWQIFQIYTVGKHTADPTKLLGNDKYLCTSGTPGMVRIRSTPGHFAVVIKYDITRIISDPLRIYSRRKVCSLVS